jgi:PAS domain S-box-containing protein
MSELGYFVAFTLVPGGMLAIAVSFSLYEVYRIGDTRLLVVILVLGFMLVHQTGEWLYFFENGVIRDQVAGEVPESAANLVASGGVYFVLAYVRRERVLKRELADSKADVEAAADRLELIFENVNDGIFLVDVDEGRIAEANERACELLRYDRSELVGMSPADIHPHEQDAYQRFVSRARTDGGAVTDQLSCRRRDGTDMPAAISASDTTLTVDGNEVILVSVRDNTRRIRYRQQLELFGRILRHNLRNELNVVMGKLELIRTNADGSDTSERATEAIQTCQELADLSDDIRRLQDTLKRERTRAERTTDLVTVTKDAVREVRERHPAADVSVYLPELARVRAGGDIGWAVYELLENAVVHAEREDPSVEVRIRHTSRSPRDGGTWVVLTIADNGPGIPELERAVVEDASTRTALDHGSGVGLWVAWELVQLYEGELDLGRRSDGAGTVVHVRLPHPVN